MEFVNEPKEENLFSFCDIGKEKVENCDQCSNMECEQNAGCKGEDKGFWNWCDS
ncbi:hypothetical protein X275_11030 [Marinitoga sp. 1197]|uniref:hypothetical protein n=1 Tax=Marinitoga sp. 1197 TaxID=1428449 RepID=UPI0006597206|nr:hypothetical protein [Marinitoga sp. 1197]KLO20921.1 hypothetical protein X275_11030 [Marinitoga sp. 1197]